MPRINVKKLFKEFNKGKLPWHLVLEKKVAKKTAYKYYYIWTMLQKYDELVNYFHHISTNKNFTINKNLIKDLLKWGKSLHPKVEGHYKIKIEKIKNKRAWAQAIICHICKQLQIMAYTGEIDRNLVKDFSEILKKYKISARRFSLVDGK